MWASRKNGHKSMVVRNEQTREKNGPTDVKLLKKVEFEVCDNGLPYDERHICLTMYECNFCHWRFYADIVRFGHGYNSEYKQTPNYCPGCGRRINK